MHGPNKQHLGPSIITLSPRAALVRGRPVASGHEMTTDDADCVLGTADGHIQVGRCGAIIWGSVPLSRGAVPLSRGSVPSSLHLS